MIQTPFTRMLWAIYPLVYDRLWDNELTASLADAVVSELPQHLPVEEVGAGTGLFTRRIARAGLVVTASEPNSRMRALFEARLPLVPIIAASVDALPPVRRTPCSVVAANVVHLTRDPVEALTILRRRAARGGRVVLVTPSPRATVGAIARAQRRHGGSRRAALGFVALHVLLAPLTVVSGGGATARHLARVKDEDALRARATDGVARVLVFEGVSAEEGAIRT